MPSRLSRRELLASAAAFAATASPSSEPFFWTASHAAAEIRKRKISSEDLTKLMLDRIRERNARLNAFITITADQALEQARVLDREAARKSFREIGRASCR